MRQMREQATKKDPSRPVLAMAVGLMGLGALLLVLSFVLGSNPVLQAAGKGLRVAAPYCLLAGIALLVLSVVLRPKPDEPSRRTHEPTLFGKDTTDFAPQTDRGSMDDPTLPVHRGQRPPAMAWSARVFDDIEWRRFQALCESLFDQAGFDARTEAHGADGGADIWLHAPSADAPAAVVRCRHRPGKPVDIAEMRDFHGVMAAHKLHRGTFAASSTFTAQAQQFAKENGISALDGQRLLALISGRTPAQQQALLAIAYEGEYWRPTCASCGAKMVERPTPRRKGSVWGCTGYPQCRFTLPARTLS